MPMLLTSTSASGTARTSASQPLAPARSAATPSTSAPGTSARICASAPSTRAWVRPLTTTRAPSAASSRAVANPMPAVEPVTTARLPVSPRSMVSLLPHLGAGGPTRWGFSGELGPDRVRRTRARSGLAQASPQRLQRDGASHVAELHGARLALHEPDPIRAGEAALDRRAGLEHDRPAAADREVLRVQAAHAVVVVDQLDRLAGLCALDNLFDLHLEAGRGPAGLHLDEPCDLRHDD